MGKIPLFSISCLETAWELVLNKQLNQTSNNFALQLDREYSRTKKSDFKLSNFFIVSPINDIHHTNSDIIATSSAVEGSGMVATSQLSVLY